MDIINELISALIAGAAVAGKDVGNKAIEDAYGALKNVVSVLFDEVATAIKKLEADPASTTAMADLRTAVPEINTKDASRLQPVISQLNDAIAVNPAASAIAQTARRDMNVIFRNMDELKSAGVVSKGFEKVNVELTDIKKAEVGLISAEIKSGN